MLSGRMASRVEATFTESSSRGILSGYATLSSAVRSNVPVLVRERVVLVTVPPTPGIVYCNVEIAVAC
jgi:hypothetical protein